MYFCGEFRHTLDEKNRLVIPAKFRTFIQDPRDKEGFYLLTSPAKDEKCLRLYVPSGWQRQMDVIREESQAVDNPVHLYRLYASHSEFIPADTQSRIVLPQKRLDQISLTRELMLVGTFDWIEIWDPREYEEHQNRIREKYSGSLTRSLMPRKPAVP